MVEETCLVKARTDSASLTKHESAKIYDDEPGFYVFVTQLDSRRVA